MRTLQNHTIIYDDECPMCNLYTGTFVKTKMLDRDGRLKFSGFNSTKYPKIDITRSRDEIALVNTQTGDVTYGIDSLFKILSNAFPWLNWIFRLRPFHFAMQKLYAFVSFNRKVIAPAEKFESPGSCNPSFNLKYRWAYIVISWMFTSFILSNYALRLTPVIPETDFIREWIICGGQIVFQSLVVGLIRKKRLIHYLGNMMTVSNIGAILLLPALLITQSSLFHLIWFLGVVGFMFFEHYRRNKILELPLSVSLSWLVYRFIVLLIIL